MVSLTYWYKSMAANCWPLFLLLIGASSLVPCMGAAAGRPSHEVRYPLPAGYMQTIWPEIQSLPTENDVQQGDQYSWNCIGPYGFNVNYSQTGLGRYMGRVLDVAYISGFGLRFGAASGGLWNDQILFPTPISDTVTSLAISSFDSPPGDPNTIVVGTGESGNNREGTGLWRTSDGGRTWSAIPSPATCFRVRFENASTVHAATTSGYFKSTDSGLSWVLKLPGNCTDFTFAQNGFVKEMYAGIWGDGIFKSTDDGETWSLMNAPSIAKSDIGRIAVTSSYDQSTLVSQVYVAIGRDYPNQTLLHGVYKTVDAGAHWTDVTPADTTRAYQVDYDNVIAACPTNPNIVLAGWVSLYRTTDGGATWQFVDNLDPNNHDNYHGDWHALTWMSDGTTIYSGNDGGVSISYDAGVTWNSRVNNAPITQFYNVDVGISNPHVIYAAAQDDGIVGTTDGGASWLGTECCDGSSTMIDPWDASHVYCSYGSGPAGGSRQRSTDYGYTWSTIDNGLPPGIYIRNDGFPPVTLYTDAGPYVYSSLDNGDHWSKVNSTPFSANVYTLAVGRFSSGGSGSLVYAGLSSSTPGQQLMVYDQGTWADRSGSFPDVKAWIQQVVPHPVNYNEAYALLSNVFNPGQKIYKTVDRGHSWTNVTGDLPNVWVTGLVPHPTNENILYVGSQFGCYKTTDGGSHWYRWNNGMPQANLVSELVAVDSLAINGKFYVIASSYGRSLWMRDASYDDPLHAGRFLAGIRTTIASSSVAESKMTLTGYPVSGKVVNTTASIDSIIFSNDRYLTATLEHQGVVDTLFHSVNFPAGVGTADFIGTRFDDASTADLSHFAPPFSGVYKPYQPLAIFNTTNPNGDWTLKVYDNAAAVAGMLQAWSFSVEYKLLTDVSDPKQEPSNFLLEQNYPNPFNPSTTFRFQLPADGAVSLVLYDILGRRVATLLKNELPAGAHEVRLDGSNLPSGVYVYRLRLQTHAVGGSPSSHEYVETKSCVLIK